MKKRRSIAKILLVVMLVGTLLVGCSQENDKSDITETKVITQANEETTNGNMQTIKAIAVKYNEEIDASSLSVEDFNIEGFTVTAVHTNNKAAVTSSNVKGNYVIIEVASTGMNRGNGGAERQPPERPSGESGEFAPPSGGEAPSGELPDGATPPSGDMKNGPGGGGFKMTLTQTGDVSTTSGETYEASTAAVELDLPEVANPTNASSTATKATTATTE